MEREKLEPVIAEAEEEEASAIVESNSLQKLLLRTLFLRNLCFSELSNTVLII